MRGKPFKFKRLVIGGLLLMAMAAVWVVFFYRPTPDLPPLPEPNGHDFIVKAGAAIRLEPSEIRAISIPPTNSWADLRHLVSTNGEALRLVGEGLRHESRAPMSVYDKDDMSHTMWLMSIRSLVRVMAAKAAIERFEGHTNEAAVIAFDAAKLGVRATEGGPMIDFLVGTAAAQNGLDTLKLSIAGLTVHQCRELQLKLDGLAAELDTPEEVVRAERAWIQYNFGVKGTFVAMWENETLRPYEEFRTRMRKRYNDLNRVFIELRILLAAQRFRLEKSLEPDSVETLVPDYLRSVPPDPETGKPMTLPK
ncbi:MAG: hypothetical protein ACKVJX_19290 [Verrucomicrobiia bacterium]|jgi:hypothetical protein